MKCKCGNECLLLREVELELLEAEKRNGRLREENERLRAENERIEEALADTFGAAVAQADLVHRWY